LRQPKNLTIPPSKKKKEEIRPRYHLLVAFFFGALATFFVGAFLYGTLLPFFQMTTYLTAITSGKAQKIHKTDFIFSPYTYAQRMIRYEYLKYLGEQNIDKTNIAIYDDAIAKMEELVVIEGTNPYQHIQLGRAFEKKVDILHDQSYFLKAEESYKKAIELAPQRQETYYAYGLSLVRQNRLKEAVAMLERPPALDPEIPISYFYLGLAQFNLGQDAYIDVLKNLEFFFQRSADNPDQKVSREVYEKLLFYFYQQHDPTRFLIAGERIANLDASNQGLYLQAVALMKKNNQFPTLEFQGGKLVSVK